MKKRQKQKRNPVAKDMIENPKKGGYHRDRTKYKRNPKHKRKPQDEEDV